MRPGVGASVWEPCESVFQPTAAGKLGLACEGHPRVCGRYAAVPLNSSASRAGVVPAPFQLQWPLFVGAWKTDQNGCGVR
jgi:hypothetical protein